MLFPHVVSVKAANPSDIAIGTYNGFNSSLDIISGVISIQYLFIKTAKSVKRIKTDDESKKRLLKLFSLLFFPQPHLWELYIIKA